MITVTGIITAFVTEIALIVVASLTTAAIVAIAVHWRRSRSRIRARCRGRVYRFQIRRARDLAELRSAMRRDAEQLRQALDDAFDNLEDE